ncbi:MAG: sodium:proton antiporter [Acidobacteriota bacterium]
MPQALYTVAATAESHAILETLSLAIFLGISAQVLAHRLQIPAILPLLLAGMAAGPFGLGLFDPAALGASQLEVIIHLGVAVILFEGGLSLDLRQLQTVSASVRNLLTIGCAVTGIGSAIAANQLVGVSWATAALFGAIVTVTGPTVIQPLLRHMIVPRKVRTILISEGLVIDPIGVVLAYLVLLWIERAGAAVNQLFVEVFILFLTGTILGYFGAELARISVARRQVPEELRNLIVLTILVATYHVAETQALQSGIVASVVMGLRMSAADIPDLNPVKAFKGQLTVLTISILFVLLSARLDLDVMSNLGWRGIAVVFALILIVRPLSVLFSIPPKQLDWREKTVLAFTAPRGIVAAAVGSLSAIELTRAGIEDGGAVEGLVYLTILISCGWATVMSLVLPRVLGYVGDPSRRRVVLVGANPLALQLARYFKEHAWTVVVIDSAINKLDLFQEQGFEVVSGDARDAQAFEDAGVERDSKVIALTTNDHLNLLAAELVRDEFGVEHPAVAIQSPSEEFGSRRRAWVDVLGGDDIELDRWLRRIQEGRAQITEIPIASNDPQRLFSLRALLRPQLRAEVGNDPSDYLIVCGWSENKPQFRVELENLDSFDRLMLLTRTGEPQQRLLAASDGLDVEQSITDAVPLDAQAVSDAQ